ncbi:deoxyguanosinetriphosphate triphosphohydrolase [Aggregatibacter kilianii]|jgi:putative dGTPase
MGNFKFTWDKLLSSIRLGQGKEEDRKIAFNSDYKRILTSPAFRRLQDKTQVFPLERNDFIHTRLTHSMEVAMIAKELATDICQYEKELNPYLEQICRIVESASLLHDIGNPPFGHFGEDIIRDWFSNRFKEVLNKRKIDLLQIDKADLDINEQHLSDLKNFEGNAQALRIVTKLHNFYGTHGMDLTVATLNTIIKYTRNSSQKSQKDTTKLVDKKIGYFFSEKDIFERIVAETGVRTSRHPLTFILEAADDIAYLTADIEDAFEKGVTTFEEFKNFLRGFKTEYKSDSDHLKKLNEYIDNRDENHINIIFSKIRKYMINAAKFSFTKNYISIMNGDFNQDLFKDSRSEDLHEALSKFSIKYIFNDKNILKLEVSGHTILTFLLDKFIPAVIPPEPISKLDKKLWKLIAEKHVKVYEECKEKIKDENELLYHRILMVTDFISGMTDSYAHDLYLILSGNEI